MLQPEWYIQFDQFLRKVRNTSLPHGGLQVIWMGDLYRLAPVKTGEMKIEHVPQFAFEVKGSHSFKQWFGYCVSSLDLFRCQFFTTSFGVSADSFNLKVES